MQLAAEERPPRALLELLLAGVLLLDALPDSECLLQPCPVSGNQKWDRGGLKKSRKAEKNGDFIEASIGRDPGCKGRTVSRSDTAQLEVRQW